MNLTRRGFVVFSCVTAMMLGGCSQAQQTETAGKDYEKQMSPSLDYLNGEEVSGFLAESENIEAISEACQNRDEETCSEKAQALIDACDALMEMDEVPGEVAGIHSELTQAADEFRNAAVSYMTAVYVDDESKFENAVLTASEYVSAGSEHLLAASELIDDLAGDGE